MRAARHLRHLIRGRWFRRLFAVRVVSQFADGVFQVALASYLIFSPERQASPAAIAGALATVLLPFSVLGPFAGVLLDRWSRRQVLVFANLSRSLLVVVLVAGVAADLPGLLLILLILACLSVNRFLLAGLSAALPHVVRSEDLVSANALTPTCGTFAAIAGLAAGSVLRATADGWYGGGDVVVLTAAAVVYGVAASLALRIPRSMLGPDVDPARSPVRHAAAHVVRGLADGLRHLSRRRTAAVALGVVGAHRFFFGIATVMLILLYRNFLHSPTQVGAAFSGLALAVLSSGAGFVAAALLTPVVTERVSLRAWILVLLVVAAVSQVVPGGLFTEPALLTSSFFLGLAAQGTKICVDTLVQEHVDDEFRGRVFSIYDVVFNAAFVGAAAVAAVVLPSDGASYPVLAAVAVGYLASALLFALLSRARTGARQSGHQQPERPQSAERPCPSEITAL